DVARRPLRPDGVRRRGQPVGRRPGRAGRVPPPTAPVRRGASGGPPGAAPPEARGSEEDPGPDHREPPGRAEPAGRGDADRRAVLPEVPLGQEGPSRLPPVTRTASAGREPPRHPAAPEAVSAHP